MHTQTQVWWEHHLLVEGNINISLSDIFNLFFVGTILKTSTLLVVSITIISMWNLYEPKVMSWTYCCFSDCILLLSILCPWCPTSLGVFWDVISCSRVKRPFCPSDQTSCNCVNHYTNTSLKFPIGHLSVEMFLWIILTKTFPQILSHFRPLASSISFCGPETAGSSSKRLPSISLLRPLLVTPRQESSRSPSPADRRLLQYKCCLQIFMLHYGDRVKHAYIQTCIHTYTHAHKSFFFAIPYPFCVLNVRPERFMKSNETGFMKVLC